MKQDIPTLLIKIINHYSQLNHVKTFTTQLKPIKACAHLYINQELLKSPEFPFESDEILKIEIQDDKLVILKPQWLEMLDWSMEKPTTRDKIKNQRSRTRPNRILNDTKKIEWTRRRPLWRRR